MTRLKTASRETKASQPMIDIVLVFCFFSRDFYEQLDRLKTPELDETLDPSREEREKKPSLPLDLYKRQLNRVFSIYTKGRIINWDTCKTRDPAAKQVWCVEQG